MVLGWTLEYEQILEWPFLYGRTLIFFPNFVSTCGLTGSVERELVIYGGKAIKQLSLLARIGEKLFVNCYWTVCMHWFINIKPEVWYNLMAIDALSGHQDQLN